MFLSVTKMRFRLESKETESMHVVTPVTVDVCLCEAGSRGWENGTYVPEERLDRSKGTTDVEDGQSGSGACLAAFLPSDSTLPPLWPGAGMGIETQHAGRNETAIQNYRGRG
ncbi:hypothetical protein WH47_06764 [Habropoda laboriosa]|uniref:Uncharacterized protein n=1 Tax=Habropoda laboriosa TaxID=597456 RepID=A0A0L7RIR4_9HYME|nr:hypothetical protein WH47_06764 [Habropoda laboriosa]